MLACNHAVVLEVQDFAGTGDQLRHIVSQAAEERQFPEKLDWYHVTGPLMANLANTHSGVTVAG